MINKVQDIVFIANEVDDSVEESNSFLNTQNG